MCLWSVSYTHLDVYKRQTGIKEEDVTVFDTTGIALQDLAAAACALRRAEALGIGTVVRL